MKKRRGAQGSGMIAAGKAHELAELVEYAKGAVVSRTIAKNRAGTLTAFAFDKGQELSEHEAPFDAFVQVLDGEGRFIIAGKSVRARAGDIVRMSANIPHAVKATKRFKMLLMMLRAAK